MSYEILLASGSPRRRQLLQVLGIPFRVIEPAHSTETYPGGFNGGAIAEYLAAHKALAYQGILTEKQILLTADTVVWLNGRELGKPAGREEAVSMLQDLSGCTHQVFTGVCLKTPTAESGFSVSTDVTFGLLSREEIEFYVDQYKPFDKAGAYGIQEWIGHTGVERIHGSYFNVMGLPVQRVYSEIKAMIRSGND